MKKLLLLGAAALLASSSAMAYDTWALVGSFTNWGDGTPIVFQGSGNNLTCSVEKMTSDFKIVPYDNNSINWEYAYSTSTPVEVNKTYTLTGRNGSTTDIPNTTLNVWGYISNATVNWNPTTEEMTINGTVVNEWPQLYVTGAFCGWDEPGTGNSVLMTQSNGIYTATIDLGSAGGEKEFKFAGAGWANEIAGGGTLTSDESTKVTKGGGNLKTSLTGSQTVYLNLNTMLATFGDEELTVVEPDPVWAIVGSFTNWGDGTPIIFEGEGNELSCTIEKMTTSFKIVPYDNSVINWDYAYSTSTPVEVGKTYELTGRNGGDEIPNIEFGGNILYVDNATVTWNPSSAELTITGSAVTGMPTLYVVGGFALNEEGNWAAPGEPESILCEEVDGIYTAKVNLGENESVEFKLAGEGWSNEIAGGVTVGYDPVTVTKGGANLKTELTGEQTLVFIYDEMTMYFAEDEDDIPTTPPTGGDDGDDDDDDDEGDGPTVAISSIDADNAQAVYYNLQGVRVNNPENGVFIVKKGDKTYKVVIR